MNVALRGDISQGVEPTLPAAKLHVLHLEPIKAKMGDRWGRLWGSKARCQPDVP
jgi:hypothetical protein